MKSPAALFKIGHGDCKSFSIAEAALLRALGFKGIRYRFAAYPNGYGRRTDYTHVYVIVRHGGRDVILDAVHDFFDAEEPYERKKDVPAAQGSKISGLPGQTPSSPSTMTLIALGLLLWMMTSANK